MIRAELEGANKASAFGIEATGNAPVLVLCRKLVAAGHDPAEPLEAYRGDVMCLRVRSIGEGAALSVTETADRGPYFSTFRPFQMATRNGDIPSGPAPAG